MNRVAALAKIVRAQRVAVESQAAPLFAQDIADYFKRLAPKVHVGGRAKAWKADDGLDPIDWEAEEADLDEVVRKHFTLVGQMGYDDVNSQLGTELDFNSGSGHADRLLTGATAVALALSQENRDKLTSLVQNNPDLTGDGINTYLHDAVLQWAGVDDIDKSRAMVIARTETAHAYTWASSSAYRESGLVETVTCLDSPDCGWDGHDDGEEADGTIRTLDEAEEFPTSHPNCVRAFAPNVLGLA